MPSKKSAKAVVERSFHRSRMVSQALQPILAKNRVRNVPAEGLWSWNPGSYFGMYHPDTFWLDGPETR